MSVGLRINPTDAAIQQKHPFVHVRGLSIIEKGFTTKLILRKGGQIYFLVGQDTSKTLILFDVKTCPISRPWSCYPDNVAMQSKKWCYPDKGSYSCNMVGWCLQARMTQNCCSTSSRQGRRIHGGCSKTSMPSTPPGRSTGRFGFWIEVPFIGTCPLEKASAKRHQKSPPAWRYRFATLQSVSSSFVFPQRSILQPCRGAITVCRSGIDSG